MQVAERRRRVTALLDEGLSKREVCRRLGIGWSTLYADLKASGRKGPANAPPAPLDNQRARKHGVYSERNVAPLRVKHAAELAGLYPWMDDGRRAMQAQRLAMVELGAAWLDEQGDVVRDDEGKVYDIADKLSRWMAQAEAWYARAEEERRDRDRPASRVAAMQGTVVPLREGDR